MAIDEFELSFMEDSPDLLQDLLEERFTSELKSAILKSLFNCKLKTVDFDQDHSLWRGYFEFYSEQCIEILNSSIGTCPVKTHRDLIKLVRILKTPGTSREDIKDRLRKQMKEPDLPGIEESLNDAVDLAARISLMTFVGSFHFDPAEHRTLLWKDSDIQTLIRTEFTIPQLPTQNVRMEKLFNARNLQQIGGINIDWTNNLADHLLMHDDANMVSIFHHASFLKLHQENSIFPLDSNGKGLIEETLRTISLLFPPHDRETISWFKKQPKHLNLDLEATRCKHLKAEDRQIAKFNFWQDRLSILKEVFDESEPKSVKQWWRDRRKPVQWYNFWLAIALIAGLTIFFGVIGSIEGALQVYKAYHPS